MQALKINKINKKKELGCSLHRGSICEIKKVKFKTIDEQGNQKKVGLSEFYPHIKFDKIEYAVVLNHSCSLSLEHKSGCSTPYINLGFLEPIAKKFERSLDQYFGNDAYLRLKKEHFVQGQPHVSFYDVSKLKNKISKNLKKTFQNNDNWDFFVALGTKSPQLFYINLLKTVPIKVNHYSVLFDNVKFQLHDEFADALGWKIAELYGQMGTTDYTQDEIDLLLTRVVEIIKNDVLDNHAVFALDEAQFKAAKSLEKAQTSKVVKFLVENNLLKKVTR